MTNHTARGSSIALCLLLAAVACAQDFNPEHLVTTGQVTVDGREVPYEVRHLPPASFPDLPDAIADALTQRNCLIPQTYAAHQPENVIHGSFQRPGSDDWAMLCSRNGEVSLLVFFSSNPAHPMTVASAPETKRLQVHPSTTVLGFNWGIDAATPDTVHDAQVGLTPRPRPLDHDALADSVVDHATAYRYYSHDRWSVLATSQ